MKGEAPHSAFADGNGGGATVFPVMLGWSRAIIIEKFLSCYIAPFAGTLTRESSLSWGSFCDDWHSGLPVTTALSPVYMGLKENSGKSLQSSGSEVPSQLALSLQLAECSYLCFTYNAQGF